jgi:hypothetical protein
MPRAANSWWGEGEIVEETYLPAPEPAAEPCLQLIRFPDGKHGIRFAHYHGRRWGRDPLVVTEDDLRDLKDALRETPRLRALLRRLLPGEGGLGARGVEGRTRSATGRRSQGKGTQR